MFYILTRKEILRIKSNKYRGITINRNRIDRRFNKESRSLERNLLFSMVNSLFLLVKFVFTFCFCLIAVWQTEREPRCRPEATSGGVSASFPEVRGAGGGDQRVVEGCKWAEWDEIDFFSATAGSPNTISLILSRDGAKSTIYGSFYYFHPRFHCIISETFYEMD